MQSFADLYDFQRKIGYLAITRPFSVEGAEPDQDLEILTDGIEDEDDVGMIGCCHTPRRLIKVGSSTPHLGFNLKPVCRVQHPAFCNISSPSHLPSPS